MDNLKQEILKFEVDLVGFANLSGCLPDVYKSYPCGISIAKRIPPSVIKMIRDNGPTIDYFAETLKINDILTEAVHKTADLIKQKGFNALFLPSTITDRRQYNRETMSVAFPHKTAATSAGLGFIGKSALFVSYEYGPSVRLATVLTDMRLDTAEPVLKSECYDCMTCSTACPGNAISGKNWKRGMAREEFFDARNCFETAKKTVKEKTGINSDTCGICLAACSRNKLEGYDLSYKIGKPESYLAVGKMFLKRSAMESLPVATRLGLAEDAKKSFERAVKIAGVYPEALKALRAAEECIKTLK